MKKLGGIIASFVLTLVLILPVSAADSFQKDLKYGMSKNSEVKRLQQYLKDEKLYIGPISGNYYGLTQAGVIKLQKKYGLKPANGRFTKILRDKINSLLLAKEETKNQILYNTDNNIQTEEQQLAESMEALRQYELMKAQQPQITINDQTFAAKYPNAKPLPNLLISSPSKPQLTQADIDYITVKCNTEAEKFKETYLNSNPEFRFTDLKVSPDFMVNDEIQGDRGIAEIIIRIQEKKQMVRAAVNHFNSFIPLTTTTIISYPPELLGKTCQQIAENQNLLQIATVYKNSSSYSPLTNCDSFQKDIDFRKDHLEIELKSFDLRIKQRKEMLKNIYDANFSFCMNREKRNYSE